MRNLINSLIAWVKAVIKRQTSKLKNWIKKQLQRFRAWLNTSRLILAITMLAIGISWTFVYDHRADIETVKKIRIEVNIAEASGAPVKAIAHQAIEQSEPKKSTSGETGKTTSNPDIALMIQKAFPEDPEIMLAIAKAESRLNPKAHNDNNNGTIDTGIFQINSVHGYDEKWLQDPENNIKAARAIYEKQGLTAWATFNYAKAHNRPI